MFRKPITAAAVLSFAIAISASSSAMAIAVTPPPAEPEVPSEPETPIIVVTIPTDEPDDAITTVPGGDNEDGSSDRHDGCSAEIARYAHIRINADYLNAIDGSEPVRLVDICSATSLSESLNTYSLAQYGNVTGLHNVIAENPVLALELSAHRYDASDVVAVVPGKGATYLMVHSN